MCVKTTIFKLIKDKAGDITDFFVIIHKCHGKSQTVTLCDLPTVIILTQSHTHCAAA